MTGEDYLLPYHHRLVSQLLGESGRKLAMVFGGGDGGSSLSGAGGGLRRQTCNFSSSGLFTTGVLLLLNTMAATQSRVTPAVVDTNTVLCSNIVQTLDQSCSQLVPCVY